MASDISLAPDIDAGDARSVKRARKGRRRRGSDTIGNGSNQGGSNQGGPQTYHDIFKFAEVSVPRIQDVLETKGIDIEVPLVQLMPKQVVITTSYSGIGSAEWAARFVQKAFNDHGFAVGVTCYSATDLSETCRHVLGRHREPPQHIFQDILSRMSPDTVNELKAMQKRYYDLLPSAVAVDEARCCQIRAAVKDLGGKFFLEAIEYLLQPEMEVLPTAWCSACNQECRLIPPAFDEGGAVWVEIAGNTCTPWSSCGALMGWLGAASLPSLVWGAWLHRARPHLVINECTPHWPATTFFQKFLGDSSAACRIDEIKVSPDTLGIPCLRPRLYTVVSSGTCTTELMPLPSLFRQTMVRELVADGGLFFCAPDYAKDRATEDMFAARRIHLPPDGVRGVRSEALLTFSVRQRLKGFKALWQSQATQEAEDAEASEAIVDISKTLRLLGHRLQAHAHAAEELDHLQLPAEAAPAPRGALRCELRAVVLQRLH